MKLFWTLFIVSIFCTPLLATTVPLTWYNGNTQLTVPNDAQSCEYGGTLILPPEPTPSAPGYIFDGWTIKEEYTYLEYLENTDYAYIDTGVTLNANSNISVKFNVQSDNGNRAIFGAGNGSTWNSGEISLFYYRLNNESLFDIVYPTSNTNSALVRPGPAFSPNTDYTVTMNKNTVTINGTAYTTGWYTSYQGQRSCYLFFWNRGTTTGSSDTRIRIYYFTLSDNGSPVRNMIPAKRNSDNVLGMYDTVSQTFFTNAGGGTFVAGPAIQ